MAKADLIELVRERQVRGATEHFYRLPAEDRADRADADEGEQDAETEEESRHPVAVG